MDKQVIVFVVSDSIGETAERVARAAASQFREQAFEFKRVPYAVSSDSLDEVLEEAASSPSLIVHTLVSPELRDYLNSRAAEQEIPCVDIMGPTLKAISRVSKYAPRLQPGLVHELDEEYYREIEAVEFAVKYDDGKDPRGLLRADVVLIGVSRTSKTPLSMYLAHRGYRVANVPLVPEVSPPEELFMLPAERIIGLTICEQQLKTIREERLKVLGLQPNANYASDERIHEELSYAQRIMRRLGCRVIDVTQRAVEETASQVMQMLAEQGWR
ncbi:MAG: kinase/pyrophosphorylase [Firmicutes bacterium]|nr:kinase/pyrophosphorylase [Bacillota bacterium]